MGNGAWHVRRNWRTDLHELGDDIGEDRLSALCAVLVAREGGAFRRDGSLLSLNKADGELLRVVAGVADASQDVGAVVYDGVGLHESSIGRHGGDNEGSRLHLHDAARAVELRVVCPPE